MTIQETIAKAIDDADSSFGYNMRLVKLLDGVSTYKLTIGLEEWIFVDYQGEDELDDAVEQCHAMIRKKRNETRAYHVMEALSL